MSISVAEIKDLQNLITNSVPAITSINNYSTNALLPPGENYGSLLFSVTLEIQDAWNRTSELNLVAKLSPRNALVKKQFNTAVTFKREISLYKIIAPILIEFQQNQGSNNVISFFPKCYGSRTSLNLESDIVDDDAVILLENLKFSGFSNGDRLKGFDLYTAMFLLKELAVLHAVPIAIKMLKPDIFQSKLLPHLSYLELFKAFSEDINKSMIAEIIETAKLNKDCVPLIPKILSGIEASKECRRGQKVPREPFATIIHQDFWVNNTMIKLVDSRPVESKIIDFQTMEYGSPGNDIIFFLYSSIHTETLKIHFDELIQCYYQTFIDTLSNLHCDLASFSYESLMREIEHSAKAQFSGILHKLRFILGPAVKGKSVQEFTEKDVLFDNTVTDEYRERIPEVILDFYRRKWI